MFLCLDQKPPLQERFLQGGLLVFLRLRARGLFRTFLSVGGRLPSHGAKYPLQLKYGAVRGISNRLPQSPLRQSPPDRHERRRHSALSRRDSRPEFLHLCH
nr:MAG TPA: hypothetical protein [Caudoviricetes sp.]